MTETVLEAAPPASGLQPPAIRTLDLAKRYGNTVALAGVTMTVPQGEIFGFLGPNGAGKTTAVKLLLGLARPTSGEAWMLGEPVGNRQVRRRVGYLPELFRYQEWLTGREVLALHCSLAGLPRRTWREEIEDALLTVGLQERGDDRVATYSKGMQQRLGLGVALLGLPDLIVLDEPTSALDPVGRHDVREIVREVKRRGKTVFLNSHLLGEVEQVCDRVAVLDHGKVVALGSVSELRGRQHAVALRLGGMDAATDVTLQHFGTPRQEDGRIVLEGITPDAVPALVAALVDVGARIYAVEPIHHSLEERFLQILEDSHGDNDHRPAHLA